MNHVARDEILERDGGETVESERGGGAARARTSNAAFVGLLG
jgi:hypothetical protein